MATELTLSTVAAEGGPGTSPGVQAAGTIQFSDKPTVNDIVSIYSTYAAGGQYDFRFVTTAVGDDQVSVGTLVSNSIYNFRDKVNNRQGLGMKCTVYTDQNAVKIQKNTSGSMFNVSLVENSSELTVSGLGGGTDASDPTDNTKTAERFVALVFKTGGAFSWNFSGYLGPHKFVDGMSLNRISSRRDWNDYLLLSKMWTAGVIKAYSLSYSEYESSVGTIRTAIENC